MRRPPLKVLVLALAVALLASAFSLRPLRREPLPPPEDLEEEAHPDAIQTTLLRWTGFGCDTRSPPELCSGWRTDPEQLPSHLGQSDTWPGPDARTPAACGCFGLNLSPAPRSTTLNV